MYCISSERKVMQFMSRWALGWFSKGQVDGNCGAHIEFSLNLNSVLQQKSTYTHINICKREISKVHQRNEWRTHHNMNSMHCLFYLGRFKAANWLGLPKIQLAPWPMGLDLTRSYDFLEWDIQIQVLFEVESGSSMMLPSLDPTFYLLSH